MKLCSEQLNGTLTRLRQMTINSRRKPTNVCSLANIEARGWRILFFESYVCTLTYSISTRIEYVASFATTASSSSFLASNSWLCSAIRRHHPPQRAVLSQICCSLFKTVAKTVKSFQNCFPQQLHWTRQFFLPLCNTFTCFHSLRFRQVYRWIQASVWNTRILFFKRYIRTLTYSILAYAYPRATANINQPAYIHIKHRSRNPEETRANCLLTHAVDFVAFKHQLPSLIPCLAMCKRSFQIGSIIFQNMTEKHT